MDSYASRTTTPCVIKALIMICMDLESFFYATNPLILKNKPNVMQKMVLKVAKWLTKKNISQKNKMLSWFRFSTKEFAHFGRFKGPSKIWYFWMELLVIKLAPHNKKFIQDWHWGPFMAFKSTHSTILRQPLMRCWDAQTAKAYCNDERESHEPSPSPAWAWKSNPKGTWRDKDVKYSIKEKYL